MSASPHHSKLSGDTSLTTAVAIMLGGSVMASSAAIWIKFLPGVSAITISLIRVAGAAILFLPFFIREYRATSVTLRDFRFSVLAGIALAFHFATWILSLKYTTIAMSVLLVATNPMFVIIISITLLRTKVAPRQILGAMVALAGIIFIQSMELASANGSAAADEMFGNILALLGGLFAAIYTLFNQSARRKLSTILHVEVTYATAAICLAVTEVFTNSPPIPLEPMPLFYLALLILLPTAGGHTIFNWGVRHLGAPITSLFILLEPIQASLLALIIFAEVPSATTVFGGLIIIAGLALAVWRTNIKT